VGEKPEGEEAGLTGKLFFSSRKKYNKKETEGGGGTLS